MLEKVAIYSKDSNLKTRECVIKLVNEFTSRGTRILLHRRSDDLSTGQNEGSAERFTDLSAVQVLPDIVLSVGGDGTFLETVHLVKDFGIPVAGVNTGRMGFLANISTDEIGRSIDMLNRGEYEIIERSLLKLTQPAGLFGESVRVPDP